MARFAFTSNCLEELVKYSSCELKSDVSNKPLTVRWGIPKFYHGLHQETNVLKYISK